MFSEFFSFITFLISDSLNFIFVDEESCIEYLINNKVLYKHPKCVKCRKATYRYKKIWKCKGKNCNWSISVYNESIFTSSKLTANRIVYIGYLWLAKCPNNSIQLITGHSLAIILLIIGNIREIDESKFGRRKYHRGHKVDGVERTSEKKFFTESVKDRLAVTLIDVLKRNILPGSIVYSDMWKGYAKLSDILEMQHKTVNHSKSFKDPITGVHTNSIEGTWNGLKLRTPIKSCKYDKIDIHISEFIWRRQNKSNLWDAFVRILSETLFN